MPSANYTLIEKITVGAGGASSVTFSGIPQTGYTDLVVAYSMRTNRSTVNAYPAVQFNGSGSSYSQRELYGTGSAAYSSSASIIQPYANGNGATSNTFGSGSIYIPNYTSSNYKSVSVDAVSENNATEGHQQLLAGLWSNTAAITSIAISAGDGSTAILQYSTFYLYGVAKLGTTPAIVPYATGGDTIMTDGTYWYHAFKSSGTFTPAKGLSCDVLVVAGGGAGGSSQIGAAYQATGGGAGGVFYSTANAVSTAKTITVGAGGTAVGQTYPFQGGNGSNSTFQGLTAAVGGGGGIYYGVGPQGINGGSGSGGGGQNSTPTPGLGTSGQGNNGGVGVYAGGGGGGAGGVGGNSGWSAAVQQAGVGGVGTSTYSSWGLVTGTGQNVSGTVYFAGGGGGGFSDGYGTPSNYNNGSYGGGGIGGSGGINSPSGQYAQLAGAGTANTGGGGGGGGANVNTSYSGGFNGANGGSGLVIIRYAV